MGNKGNITRIIRAKARWRGALQAADEGLTVDQAAKAIGISVSGLRTMLGRETGSQTWPPLAGKEKQ